MPVHAAPVSLNPADLLNRRFRFLVGWERTLLSAGVLLNADGTVSGYDHPNERSWRLEGNRLALCHESGRPSCIFDRVATVGGGLAFVGKFLLIEDGGPHYLEEVVSAGDRPEVNSFDLFDTLVARRCGTGQAIFEAVGRQARIDGFGAIRWAAEAPLVGQEYTLDDVYRLMAEQTGWPAARIDMLRLLELAEEWDNIYPIRETLALVAPGDLIVSDMYLPREFIAKLVAVKCGLPEHPIFLSAGGKRLGHAWPHLEKSYAIRLHHGDNFHSDVQSARKFGVPARHIVVSDRTASETMLADAGLVGLSECVRETRLGSFHADPLSRRRQLLQLEVNIPLQILAGFDLLRVARATHSDCLLMCSRDTHLWVRLMRALAQRIAPEITVAYFRSSRLLNLNAAPDYLAYYHRLRGERSVIVDVSGTGRTMAHLIARSETADVTSGYLLCRGDLVSGLMEGLAPEQPDVTIAAFMDQHPGYDRWRVEAMNLSMERSAQALRYHHGEVQTVELDQEITDERALHVGLMRSTYLHFMRVLHRTRPRLAAGLPHGPALLSSARQVLKQAELFDDVLGPLIDSLVASEQTTADLIAARAPA